MAPHGSSSGEFDIKSPADGYVNFFISETAYELDIITDMVPLLPIVLMIRLESKDLEKRTVTTTIHGDWVRESYKTVKATFTVTPKEHSNGSRLAWTLEFEKVRHDIGDPEKIVKYLVMYFEKIDHNFHLSCVLNGKVDFIDVESPADQCFKDFIEAFKNDATMEIEAEDWENRTSTMRMRSTHVLMRNYKTLKVTITIFPIEDTDHGTNVALTIPGSHVALIIDRRRSHVAWTIESEKFSNDIIDPDLSTNTVLYLREMIHDKLLK